MSVAATLNFEDEGLQEAARNALAEDGIYVREDGDRIVVTWSK